MTERARERVAYFAEAYCRLVDYDFVAQYLKRLTR